MTRPFWTLGFVATLALALLARADAPPCRYTIANGTVYDTRTKLTWQQTIGTAQYMQQSQAVGACTALTLAGGGWRVPKVSELLTLVDPTRTAPTIDIVAFPDTNGAYYWTSTPVANSSVYIWYVGFNDGGPSYGNPAVPPQVRCVR